MTFARSDYHLIEGTPSSEKLSVLRRTILAAGGIRPICEKISVVYPEATVDFPTIAQADLVETMSYDLLEVSKKPRIGTRYVLGANKISPTRPSAWNIYFTFF